MLKTVLCFVAHPDDVTYGMGGTMLRLKESHSIHIVCATKGERGIKGIGMSEAGSIREKEQIAECKALGAGLTFLNRTDADLFADRAICEECAGIINTYDPKAIFTLWPVDSHPDHSAISEIVKKSIAIAKSSAELYFCEEGLGSQTTSFIPDIYIDVTAVMKQWEEMIHCHTSQNKDNSLLLSGRQRRLFRGEESHYKYAEGFKTILPLALSRHSTLLNLT